MLPLWMPASRFGKLQMATRLIIKRLDRITLVKKGKGTVAKHPELRSGVVELVKAGPTVADFGATMKTLLHGPQAVQKASGPDLTGLTFDDALKALLHARD